MAKGNLFLGMGRGSVGDVTFYRTEGEQITRSRNRHPRNPKTDAQLISRAISASVMRAYSAGKTIFDHAFEGNSTPAANQRQFMSENLRRMRSDVFDVLDGSVSDASSPARLVVPKATAAVPSAFVISSGQLFQDLFWVQANSENPQKLEAVWQFAPSTNETLGQYAQRNYFAEGDIFTIVAFGIMSQDANNVPLASSTRFGFIRLITKALSAEASAKLVSAATIDDLFEVDMVNGTPIPGSTLLTSPINIDQVVSSCITGSMGVIKSREDSGLRSYSVMKVPLLPGWGLSPESILSGWSDDASKLSSSLILEGGDF